MLIMILMSLPVAVHADATSDQSSAASQLQNTGSAADSTPTGSLLQPSGTTGSPLQSADASGGGVAQSPTENLQQSGASDQAKLLIEGDGDTPHQLKSSTNLAWLWDILLVLVVATAGTGAATVLQQRRM